MPLLLFCTFVKNKHDRRMTVGSGPHPLSWFHTWRLSEDFATWRAPKPCIRTSWSLSSCYRHVWPSHMVPIQLIKQVAHKHVLPCVAGSSLNIHVYITITVWFGCPTKQKHIKSRWMFPKWKGENLKATQSHSHHVHNIIMFCHFHSEL